MRNFKNELKELTEILGVSGFETKVKEFLVNMVIKSCTNLWEDSYGNLIAKCGSDKGYKIGIFAHMDEVGFIVSSVSAIGLLSFEVMGMVDEKILPGSEVLVLTKTGKAIKGVIGNKSKHLQKLEDDTAKISYRKLTIDVGARSYDEAISMGISVGSPVSFATKCTFYDNGMVLAKSLDDRVGCLALATLINEIGSKLDDVTLYGFFTVQEEIGARGASCVANGLGLDMYICLDTVPVQNGNDIGYNELNLGRGPLIRISDGMPQFMMGAISKAELVDRAIKIAEENNIPYVCDVLHCTFLDSCTAQFTDNGVPGVSICFPRRYSHTGIEMCYLPDIDNAMTLLNLLVMSLDKEPIKFGKVYK